MRLALVNTKGGVGKTTTAMFLAAGLNAYGPTLFVDCDPQHSAHDWADGAPLPFPVIGMPTKTVHKDLPPIAAGYDHVVIDTPPGNIPVIKSAVLAADTVLIPVSSSGIEVHRLSPTFELLSELVGHTFKVAVVLVKQDKRTVAAREAPAVVAEDLEYPLMDTQIPEAERFKQAFGGPLPADLENYALLVKELLG